MKQVLIMVLGLAVVAGIIYWLLMQNATNEPAPQPTDETEAPAQPAPEDVADVPTAPTDYVGLSEAEAVVFAEENNVPFRVVERDGEMLPTTRDYRPGRINATVEAGTVVAYEVEGVEQSDDTVMPPADDDT